MDKSIGRASPSTTINVEDGTSKQETLEQSPAQDDESNEDTERERLRREREARAQALTLEIVGDLPYAEVKPPENVLFVCKLNPVTEDDDLYTIFSRFGAIVSCEVIRDKRAGDSLQYAFIEFENQKDCEQAYFKMSGVLIDDHRIHVDFSQSVSRLADVWRTKTNTKRRQQGGGFGGVAELEKKRQYRRMDPQDTTQDEKDKFKMMFDRNDETPRGQANRTHASKRIRSRSPGPERHSTYRPARRAHSRERRRSMDRWTHDDSDPSSSRRDHDTGKRPHESWNKRDTRYDERRHPYHRR